MTSKAIRDQQKKDMGLDSDIVVCSRCSSSYLWVYGVGFPYCTRSTQSVTEGLSEYNVDYWFCPCQNILIAIFVEGGPEFAPQQNLFVTKEN